ncbi:MAG TPA: radical SAM protein [Acidobacteriota bacterium]
MPSRPNSVPQPRSALIATTFKCNARCVMCNIWRVKEHNDLKPEEYRDLPRSLEHINVSGGEPFLRKDLVEIVGVLAERCPAAHQVISSNGFLPEVLEEQVGRMLKITKKLGVRVSFDGVGAVHEEIRGTPGAFDRCVRSIQVLHQLGVRDLGIAFTASDGNIEHIDKAYQLSLDLGVQFSFAAAQSSAIFFQADGNAMLSRRPELARAVDRLATRELRGWHPKRWYRALFETRLKHFVLGELPFTGCSAGSSSFYLAPDGTVYPCNIMEAPLGNLRQQRFEELWAAPRAWQIRERVDRCPHPCYMICSSASDMRHRVLEPLPWIAKSKARAHLGLPPGPA